MPKPKPFYLKTAYAIAMDYGFGQSRRNLMRKYPDVSERQIRKIMACIRGDPLLTEMGTHLRWQVSFSRFVGAPATDSVPPLRHDV
jgi:hypothetical protein